MQTIEEYLCSLPAVQQTELRRVRDVIVATVPGAEEGFSYGMPAFKYKGKYLVGFFAFKNHMSLFPGAGPIETLAEKLQAYTISKGTIQFTLEHPLSDGLIREVVEARVKEIEG